MAEIILSNPISVKTNDTLVTLPACDTQFKPFQNSSYQQVVKYESLALLSRICEVGQKVGWLCHEFVFVFVLFSLLLLFFYADGIMTAKKHFLIVNKCLQFLLTAICFVT